MSILAQQTQIPQNEVNQSEEKRVQKIQKNINKRTKKQGHKNIKNQSRYSEENNQQEINEIQENLKKIRKNLNFDHLPSNQDSRQIILKVQDRPAISIESQDIQPMNMEVSRQLSNTTDTTEPINNQPNSRDSINSFKSDETQEPSTIISVFEIFQKIDNDEMYIDRYFQSLKETEIQFSPKNFLQRHEITYLMRAKMIDWLTEVTTSYNLSTACYFIIINVMDRFFWLAKNVQSVEELHLIGLTSLFIASKYEEVAPLRLKTIVEKIGHNKFSSQQIKLKELEIMEALDYSVTGSNIYTFISVTMHKIKLSGIIQDQSQLEFLNKICYYMGKMVSFDCDLINQFSTRSLAASSIYVACKLFEQCLTQNNLIALMDLIRDYLELTNQEIVDSATHLLNLARNFEQKFPKMRNLASFNQDLLQQLQEKKQQSANQYYIFNKKQ